jgi:predicted NBD/HSP70 family sugar kinase
LPTITENDINAAVVGYSHRNNIGSDNCVVGLYFPDKYPPGAGIYLNGDIYKGKDGFAGEIKFLPFGIDWDSFDYNQNAVDDLIVKAILTFQCTFNPNTIVIYGKTGGNCDQILNEKYGTYVEKIMKPQIIFSDSLQEDYELGIKLTALKMLDTAAN